MAPTTAKANYKTYEAQARMVRAIVAAHPDVKWNYKEIVACYGSDMTDHALNHRFRRLKAQSLIIRHGRAQGFDMKNLVVEEGVPASQDAVDKNNIAKYFGQSTADGIQFQFRTIKKDADHLRQVHNAGGDVANCLPLGTPTKSVRTPGSRKRGRDVKPSSDESEDVEKDWSEEETPSKRGRGALPSGQKNGGTRRAAVRANATIASAAEQDEQEREQEDDGQRAIAVKEEYVSLFGDPGAGAGESAGAFTELSTDPVISSTMNMSMYSDAFYEGVGDDYLEGEI